MPRRSYRHRTWPRSREQALITVNNATVDQAMGLVALQDMAGVDNLDFGIAGDESLSRSL